MKKWIILCVMLWAGVSEGATLTVCSSGCGYTSLGAAVAASATGDVVDVMEAGNYTCTELLDGKSGLTIRKNPAASGAVVATIAGGGGHVFQVGAAVNNVTISGIDFDMTGTSAEIIDANAAISGWVLENTNIDDLGDEGIDCSANCGITLSNVVFTSNGSTKSFLNALEGGTIIIDQCTFKGDDTAGAGAFISLDSSATENIAATISRSNFQGGIGGYNIYVRNLGAGHTSTVTISYSILSDYEDGTNRYLGRPMLLRDAGTTVNIVNSHISNMAQFAFVLYDGLALNLTNVTGIGMSQDASSGDFVSISSGDPSVNFINTYQNPQPILNTQENNADSNTSPKKTTTTLSNMDAQLTSYRKPHGYIVLCMDDTEGDAEYQKSVVDVWQSKGVKGTLFVNPGLEGINGMDMSANTHWQALIATSYDNARNWGVHSWSHSSMNATQAFTIKMKTGDTATISITETSFIIDCSNDVGDVSFDLTNENYDSLYNVYYALAQAPYSTYYTIASFVDGTNDRMQSSSMTTIAGVSVPAAASAAYSILLDTGAPDYRYFRDQLQDTKTWIIANTNAAASDVISMASPGSDTSAAQIAYLLAKEADPNVGIRINRGAAVAGYTPSALGTSYNLRKLNTFLEGLISSQNSFGPSTGGTRTQAEVVSYATALAVYVKETGSVVSVYAHGNITGGDTLYNIVTTEEWGWFIDAVKAVDPTILTDFNALATLIKAGGSGWTQSGVNGEVWTTTFTNQADYRLKSNSVLKNAGVFVTGVHDVAGVTDYAGQDLYNMPGVDIGAYGTVKSTMVLKGGTLR